MFSLTRAARFCLFPAKYCNSNTDERNRQHVYAANGTDIAVVGSTKLDMKIGQLRFQVEGFCSPNTAEIILGLGFLKTHGAMWDFSNGTIVLHGCRLNLRPRAVGIACRRILLATDVELAARAESVVPA
jgi:hypothetical protein